jgi:hypothetical protein
VSAVSLAVSVVAAFAGGAVGASLPRWRARRSRARLARDAARAQQRIHPHRAHAGPLPDLPD